MLAAEVTGRSSTATSRLTRTGSTCALIRLSSSLASSGRAMNRIAMAGASVTAKLSR